jgi:hydroxypyruvate isomerase
MDNKLELIVPQQLTISRSFERTVNPKNYVEGRDYESMKFSSFRSRQVLADTTIEEQNKISDELYIIVKNEVETAARQYIEQLKNPANSLSGDQLKALADIVQAYSGGITKEVFTEMVNKIKDKLDEKQLGFLRNLYTVKYE